jgi:hypothetical protein
VNLKAKNVNGLLQKFTFYKGKYFVSPQQEMFSKLLDLFKFNMEEQAAHEKQEMRAKKRAVVTFYTSGKIKKGGNKFKMEDLEAVLAEKEQTRE